MFRTRRVPRRLARTRLSCRPAAQRTGLKARRAHGGEQACVQVAAAPHCQPRALHAHLGDADRRACRACRPRVAPPSAGTLRALNSLEATRALRALEGTKRRGGEGRKDVARAMRGEKGTSCTAGQELKRRGGELQLRQLRQTDLRPEPAHPQARRAGLALLSFRAGRALLARCSGVALHQTAEGAAGVDAPPAYTAARRPARLHFDLHASALR